MRMRKVRKLLPLVTVTLVSCGGGVPVRLIIDEFTMTLSMEEATRSLERDLENLGLFPVVSSIPELWPDSLPSLRYSARLATKPIAVDLTPKEGTAEAEKYEEINAVKGAIRRIELNRVVLRVERSNLSVALPELTLQAAAQKDANPDDRLAWVTIGHIPSAEAGFVGDLEFEFVPGGESFLGAQLGQEEKEFAVRVVGWLDYDTEENPRRPRGAADIRLIVVATFFVEANRLL